MGRGRALALPLVVGLFAVACGTASPLRTAMTTPPDVSRAVVLSVLSDAIYLIDPETGTMATLVRDLGDFRAGYAAWAPDHARLAYGDHGVFIRDLRSDGPPVAVIVGDSFSMPSWSPAGDRLVYGNGAAFWITPATVFDPVQLHIPATLAPLAMDWGPGGIAFQGLRRDCQISYRCPTTEQSDIWTLSPDATRLARMTYLLRALNPKWSPDGTQILFVVRTGLRSGELWAVRSDGTEPHRIARASDVVAADWSPDGTALAIVRRGTGGLGLAVWISSADGSGARQIGSTVDGTAATIDW